MVFEQTRPQIIQQTNDRINYKNSKPRNKREARQRQQARPNWQVPTHASPRLEKQQHPPSYPHPVHRGYQAILVAPVLGVDSTTRTIAPTLILAIITLWPGSPRVHKHKESHLVRACYRCGFVHSHLAPVCCRSTLDARNHRACCR
jgi:hypothetical protein